MIERITFEGFQCHEQLTLELAPVTVLVGPNDGGKSAVVRGLRWLALNEWDGKAGEHVTYGKNASRVNAFVDGVEVGRTKGKGVNGYYLDATDYPLIGTAVAKPVADVLRLTPANFQSQDDAPFWLTLTAGDAAKALNQIFHLSEIDESLARAAAHLRDCRSRESVSRERLEKAKAEVEQLGSVTAVDTALSALEEAAKELAPLEGGVAEMVRGLETMNAAARQGGRAQSLIEAATASIEALQKLHQAEGSVEELEMWVRGEEETCRVEKQLKAKDLQLSKLLKGKCPLCMRG